MTNELISKQDVHHATRADRIIRATLAQRGLVVPPAQALLTRDGQLGAVLFWRMDTTRLSRLEAYTDLNVAHHISTNLRGWPVVVCNHIGLAYGVVLSDKRPDVLPQSVVFPGLQTGQFLIGVDGRGQAMSIPIGELPHTLVVGATGSGKSTFLRLMVHQAVANDYRLVLADIDGATFPMFANHPALAQPLATTPADVARQLAFLLAEIERRREAYERVVGFPESLDEYNRAATTKLPRLLVVWDELPATIKALGGATAEFAQSLAELGWRARKFGITVLAAGQMGHKEKLGAIKESLTLTVAFQVTTAESARNVGLPGAERLRVKGRCLTDRWGVVQTYYLAKAELLKTLPPTLSVRLTSGATPATVASFSAADQRLLGTLWRDYAGRVSIPTLRALGLAEREARQVCAQWDERGWAVKDPTRSNARYLTEAVQAAFQRPNARDAQTVQTLEK